MNKKALTTISCLGFLIAGILLATVNEYTIKNKQARAAPPLQLEDVNIKQLPLDVQLNLAKETKIVTDTIIKTDTIKEILRDTVYITKYKTRYSKKKQFVPDTIARKSDTLYVPVLHLNIQLVKGEANDSAIVNTIVNDTISINSTR